MRIQPSPLRSFLTGAASFTWLDCVHPFSLAAASLVAPSLLSLTPSPRRDVKWASIFGPAACCQKPSAFLTFPLGSLWNPTIREAQRQQKIRLCSVAKKQRHWRKRRKRSWVNFSWFIESWHSHCFFFKSYFRFFRHSALEIKFLYFYSGAFPHLRANQHLVHLR